MHQALIFEKSADVSTEVIGFNFGINLPFMGASGTCRAIFTPAALAELESDILKFKQFQEQQRLLREPAPAAPTDQEQRATAQIGTACPGGPGALLGCASSP